MLKRLSLTHWRQIKTLALMRGAAPMARGLRWLTLGVLVALPSAAQTAADLARERCANRLTRSIQGQRPKAALLAEADPQANVEGLFDRVFVERFAAFVNGKFHDRYSNRPEENTPHARIVRVFNLDLPWKDVFIGQWVIGPNVATPTVPSDTAIGYFTDAGWMRRYAGNEEAGYRLSSAYRILQNTIGLKLTAATNNASGENDSVGRERPECRGCHWDGTFPLDKVARVLSRKQGSGSSMKFVPPTDGPQALLGKVITTERELLEALVHSDAFLFNSCRLAFEYLSGREETTCEAPVFDACMDTLRRTGSMRQALIAIARRPEYCR